MFDVLEQRMKVGILGTGAIANKMAETIKAMHHGDIDVAVGGRNLEKAKKFAMKYDINRYYGSYKELVKDHEVELVYIATIHTMHYDHAILAIENGKNVLIEKPMALNELQAKEIFRIADENDVFVCEAMWTRFMPSGKFLSSLNDNKEIIGEIYGVFAQIGYDLREIKRMNELSLGAGALLDIGIYPIHLAMMVLGNEGNINGECYRYAQADGADSMTYKTDKGTACLYATMLNDCDNCGYVYGSKGYLRIDNINNPQKIEKYVKNELVKCYDFSKMITGLEYEILACYDALRYDKKYCIEITREDTLKALGYMDKLRNNWQITYPQEINVVSK